MVNPLDSCTDHFDMTGNFSEDDIQHLLGVMNGSHEDSSSSISNNVQAAVEAAAAACLSDPSSSKPHHEDEIEEEAKAQARSERKRCREKQRRVDVNKQFNDLTKLVAQIEQEEREEDPTVFRQSFSATNRADLIARTIAHMERLRDANKRRKTECAALQKQLQESQKAGEEIAAKYKEELCRNNHGMMMPQQNKQVMMMVPMMMPANAAQGMPQFGMQAPMGAQFMMPQAFMPQPVAAAAPIATPQQQQAQPSQASQQPQQHQQQQVPMAQPQMPTMMAPPQMMFASMQGVYPTATMLDHHNANAAMAPTPAQMPFMNFMQPMAQAQPQPVAEATKTGGDAQAMQPQQQPSNNGAQGNSSPSAGGSNYAHCA